MVPESSVFSFGAKPNATGKQGLLAELVQLLAELPRASRIFIKTFVVALKMATRAKRFEGLPSK